MSSALAEVPVTSSVGLLVAQSVKRAFPTTRSRLLAVPDTFVMPATLISKVVSIRSAIKSVAAGVPVTESNSAPRPVKSLAAASYSVTMSAAAPVSVPTCSTLTLLVVLPASDVKLAGFTAVTTPLSATVIDSTFLVESGRPSRSLTTPVSTVAVTMRVPLFIKAILVIEASPSLTVMAAVPETSMPAVRPRTATISSSVPVISVAFDASSMRPVLSSIEIRSAASTETGFAPSVDIVACKLPAL